MITESKPEAFTSGKESALRAVTSFLAWGSWIAAVAIFAYATWQYNPNKGDFAPQWVGFSFILAIGVAVAASAARARHRLSDTILAAFTAGMVAQREQAAELAERVMETSNNHSGGDAS
jgi:hypothetical protein